MVIAPSASRSAELPPNVAGRYRASGWFSAFRTGFLNCGARVVDLLTCLVESTDRGGIGHFPSLLGEQTRRGNVGGKFSGKIVGQRAAGGTVHARFDFVGGIVEGLRGAVALGRVIGCVRIVRVHEIVVGLDTDTGRGGELRAVLGDGLRLRGGLAGGRGRGRGGGGFGLVRG